MSKADEFFVGYLPTPARLRRWVWGCAGVLVVGAVGLGLSLAMQQRDPGGGVWDDEHEVRIVGEVVERPYAMLRMTTRELRHDGQVKRVLMVAEGKRGAERFVGGMEGKVVSVKGHVLSRAGEGLLELEDGSPAEAATAAVPRGVETSLGPRVVRGEIVDIKCYDGAMKPGDGKTHKGCAILCLRGGIPPVLVGLDGSSYVLVGPGGEGLRGEALEEVLPMVGDAVEVSGAVFEVDGMRTMRVGKGMVKRR